MKRIRFALLSILTISMLMNFPDWLSGLNNSNVKTRVLASRSSLPVNAEFLAVVVSQTSGEGTVFLDDFVSFRSLDPSETLSRSSVNGLQQGENITAMEAIPSPPGLNSTTEDDPPPIISAITNQGNLYNIDCETGNAIFVALIQLLQNNNRLSYTFNSDTGVGLVLDPDAGMQMAFNPYTGQVLGSGDVNFFYSPGDVNFGTVPNVVGWEASTVDYDNDGDVDIIYYDQGTDSLGEIGGDGSLKTLFPLNLPGGDSLFDMDSPGVTFGDMDNDGAHDLYVLGRDTNDPPAPSLFGIDLNTGQTIDLGSIGEGTDMIGAFTSVRAPSLFNCAFVPSFIKRPFSSDVNFTVEITGDAGALAPGIEAQLLVTNGPNQGVTRTGVTDANGEIPFQYTSNGQPGTDTVEVSGAFEGNSFFCSATVEWKELLIENIKQNKGKTGENIVVTGFNFQPGDLIFINGEQAQKTKFKAGSGKLVAKNGERLLNPCVNGIPGLNEITVSRSPLIFDTNGFVTCP